MKDLDELAKIFSHFPGIGERQARRFVYYLLKRDRATLAELTERIMRLKESVRECSRCQKFSEMRDTMCDHCHVTLTSPTMMIVEKDSDLETIKRAGVYDGSFFVLGGLVPILDEAPERRVRLLPLKKRIESESATLSEIILALSFTREGEYTDELVRDYLRKHFPGATFTVSSLGRGLSTGTELEYADTETIKGALLHRNS
jgi:recombination protein RecR